jgi:hypothetical protein
MHSLSEHRGVGPDSIESFPIRRTHRLVGALGTMQIYGKPRVLTSLYFIFNKYGAASTDSMRRLTLLTTAQICNPRGAMNKCVAYSSMFDL